MTTAVRLPDQFSPGAAAANAATPTCCCCCCCCAVSSVGAAVHIPAALYEETKDLPRSALVLPAAIFPLLVVVLPFATMGAVFDLHWGWWLGAFGAALAWATASGFIARSPNPVGSVVRLLGWAALWIVEPFVVLFTLGPIASLDEAAAWVTGVLYLGGALALGYWIVRRYRRKR